MASLELYLAAGRSNSAFISLMVVSAARGKLAGLYNPGASAEPSKGEVRPETEVLEEPRKSSRHGQGSFVENVSESTCEATSDVTLDVIGVHEGGVVQAAPPGMWLVGTRLHVASHVPRTSSKIR